MSFDKGMFGNGLGGLLGGLFGHSSSPYDKEMEQYKQYADKSQQTQQPFLDAGTGAIGDYQKWLQEQQDPSKFINEQMGQYQESPQAQYLQQQAMRSGQNAASASGLMGSTPMMQQAQQNAGSISSQDQNNWLNHVLGINTQYGQGQQNLMQGGQSSANHLTDMYNNMGQRMGQASFNKEGNKQNNFWNTMGGIGSMIGSFL